MPSVLSASWMKGIDRSRHLWVVTETATPTASDRSVRPTLNAWLSFAGVKFSAAGELAEGPFAALGRARSGSGCACSSGNCGIRSPICGGGMNAPHIPRLVERDADHPPLAPATQRYAVCDAGGHTLGGGEVVQGNGQA